MRIQLLSIPALLALSEVSAAEPQDGGYVFRKGEGETVCCDSLVKASPKQGTSGGVAILQRMPKDFSTGLHYHIRADEFFYVVSGMGVATIGEKEYAIQEGDFVFVHAGEDHKLQSKNGPMHVLEFLDKPGLEEDFRHVFPSGTFTLEELNAVSKKHGTVYKTID